MLVRTVLWSALCLALGGLLSAQPSRDSRGWPAYGGDAGGQRYSAADQITPANVANLRVAWEFHTGALATRRPSRTEAAFEATPILHDRTLYFTTPFDRVIAVDALSGHSQWSFDPQVPDDFQAGVYTSRGVAFWGEGATSGPCDRRIFVATLDGRLWALDALTGKVCTGFGSAGVVDLKKGLPTQTAEPFREYGVTSPPTVVGDVVVVGSAVADGQEVDVEPGVVRGYDTRTGHPLWTWDPLPWARHQTIRTGGGNTWGVISADPEHGLIFLPTGSPSPDFYGGLRPGDDRDADSVVALEARTGRKVWAFQLVHHDLWDYDVAAQPLLFEYRNRVPALAIGTKMGMIFVLNRLTGAPIFPVAERPVPKSDVPGETSSPTQPFSSLPPLSPLSLHADDLAGHTLADAGVCAKKIAALRNEGIYTPPSLAGSLLYPGSLGGVNWGSLAFDPETGTLYVNSNHHAFRTRLVPRWRFELDGVLGSWENWIYASASLLAVLLVARRRFYPGWIGGSAVLLIAGCGAFVAFRPAERQHFGTETAPQRKSPFAVERSPLTDGHGLPCTPMPWGKMTALNLHTGSMAWERPLGTMVKVGTTVKGAETGSLNLGGPIVTRGGLVFAAAVREPVLRAFDKKTGDLAWTGQLPVPAQSTPMTYELDGKQYIVIAAGGHGGFGTPQGDSLIAFALP